MIQQQLFGYAGNKPTHLFCLTSSSGLTATITNYGGIIQSCMVPSSDGSYRDVVLGFDTLQEYLDNSQMYCGCLIGRYANRIAGASFTLHDTTYYLTKNESQNHLHGGDKGFDKVVWEAEPLSLPTGQGLKLTYISRDGDEGYPGNLTTTVTYFLKNNSLCIDYEAETDAPTVVCLTNHSYFNLSRDSTIVDHTLKLESDTVLTTDENLVPTGVYMDVSNSEFDFRDGRKLDKSCREIGGLDHTFICDQKADTPAAVLWSPESGIMMEMFTSEPALQVFTANNLNGSFCGKGGRSFVKHVGVCLEAQHYPDSPNRPDFPNVVLAPDEIYRQTTEYRFSTCNKTLKL